MKNRFLVHSLIALAMSAAAWEHAFAADMGPVVHQVGNVTYASGGVGEASMAQLVAHLGEFNLKLVFALKSGAYLSGVSVDVADAKGTPLLQATSEGPWFLMNLPVGTYEVVANHAGQQRHQTVTVAPNSLRTVDFRWGDE